MGLLILFIPKKYKRQQAMEYLVLEYYYKILQIARADNF